MRFAVIIGVDTYAAYERATGLAHGAAALRAPRNDAVTWVKIFRRMGLPEDNLLAICTPALGAEDVGDEVRRGVATGEGIRRGLAWLSARLEACPGAEGFIVFSGHGDFVGTDGGLVYPTDYAPGTGAPAIELGTWIQGFCASHPANSLVVFVDACRQGPLPGPGQQPGAHLAATVNGGSLIVASCRPGQLASERHVNGRWQGLFTWAVETLTEQWRLERSGLLHYVGLDYGTLAQRAGQLIGAVNSTTTPQLPIVYGDATRAVGLPASAGPGTTFGDPTRPSIVNEFPDNTNGVFEDSQGTAFGYFTISGGSSPSVTWAFSAGSAFPTGTTSFKLTFPSNVPNVNWSTFTTDAQAPVSTSKSPKAADYAVLYASPDKKIYLGVMSGGQSFYWWAHAGVLVNGYLPTSAAITFESTSADGADASWTLAKDQ